MKQNQIIIVAVLLVAALGGGFFGGMKYQQSKVPSFANGQFGNRGNFPNGIMAGQNGANGQVRTRMGGGQTIGEILNADDKSITVKLVDGSSKIVLLSSTTNINKATEGSKSDLSVGTKVAVFGQTNTDGSVTAQNIQINPIDRLPSGTAASPSPKK